MTIEAQLDRLTTAVEAILGIALASAPRGVQEDVVRTATGAPPQAPAVNTSSQTASQAPPSKPAGRKPKPATQPTPTSPPETATAPATPVVAPAASSPAPLPPGLTTAEKTLQQTTTDAIIALANDFNRDEALAILSKRRGITRCSELKAEELAGVLGEAQAAYALHKQEAEKAAAAKSSASLI